MILGDKLEVFSLQLEVYFRFQVVCSCPFVGCEWGWVRGENWCLCESRKEWKNRKKNFRGACRVRLCTSAPRSVLALPDKILISRGREILLLWILLAFSARGRLNTALQGQSGNIYQRISAFWNQLLSAVVHHIWLTLKSRAATARYEVVKWLCYSHGLDKCRHGRFGQLAFTGSTSFDKPNILHWPTTLPEW